MNLKMFVSKDFCDYYYFYVHLSLEELIQCYKDANIEYSIDGRFCYDQLTLPYIQNPKSRPKFYAEPIDKKLAEDQEYIKE